MKVRVVDYARRIERIALNRRIKHNLDRIRDECCPRCDRRSENCYPCRMATATAKYAVEREIDKLALRS